MVSVNFSKQKIFQCLTGKISEMLNTAKFFKNSMFYLEKIEIYLQWKFQNKNSCKLMQSCRQNLWQVSATAWNSLSQI